MSFLGYPWQIWAASFIAVTIKLSMANHKATNNTWLAKLATVIVALFSGIILYMPIIEIFGLTTSWHVPVAISISLISENVMRNLVVISEDKDYLSDWLRSFLKIKGDNNEK